MGTSCPVLAMAFSVVVRTTPVVEDRADDSRSLTNLTNWISQDVSSTSEDGFHIGPSESGGGCLTISLPTSSSICWSCTGREGTERYVTNYRWVSTGPSKGQIFRYACQKGGAASELRMTAELNEVAEPDHPFAPAPVEITPTPTKLADGIRRHKGIQFVVLIYDDYGIQRELLSLDATTTNVATHAAGRVQRGRQRTTPPPTASDLFMTITPPATQGRRTADLRSRRATRCS